MMNCTVNDIVIVPFEFDDKPGVIKPRPVIVISCANNSLFVIVIKITSHKPRREYPGEVVLLDWKSEGLAKPSCARCSKTARIPKHTIRQIIGHLSERDIEAVSRGIQEVCTNNAL